MSHYYYYINFRIDTFKSQYRLNPNLLCQAVKWGQGDGGKGREAANCCAYGHKVIVCPCHYWWFHLADKISKLFFTSKKLYRSVLFCFIVRQDGRADNTKCCWVQKMRCCVFTSQGVGAAGWFTRLFVGDPPIMCWYSQDNVWAGSRGISFTRWCWWVQKMGYWQNHKMECSCVSMARFWRVQKMGLVG